MPAAIAAPWAESSVLARVSTGAPSTSAMIWVHGALLATPPDRRTRRPERSLPTSWRTFHRVQRHTPS